jgi:hypothetical protein
MSRPNVGIVDYNSLKIELRHYKEYSTKKSRYTQQYKYFNKDELLANDRKYFDNSKN